MVRNNNLPSRSHKIVVFMPAMCANAKLSKLLYHWLNRTLGRFEDGQGGHRTTADCVLQRLFADGVLPFRHFMFRMFENPQLRLFYGGMQNLFPPCVLGSPRFVADDELLWRRFLLVGGDRRRRFVGVEDLLHARRFHEVLAVVLERHLLSHLARFRNAFFMKALMKPLVCFRPGNLIIRHDRMFGEAGVNVAVRLFESAMVMV